jgi:hypothetical protein
LTIFQLMNSSNYEKRIENSLIDRALARRKFLEFIKYTSPWFKVSWHHEMIADALERIENGELKRLMIFLPPRHSKSEMVSVNFPPWVLGRDKNKSIIEASYSADLATEFGRQARDLVGSRKYKNVFSTTLAEDSQSKSTWNTNGRGQYNALGVGGAATGKGADILIIDDPIKNRKEADSFLVRENIYKWYQSTARTRLSPTGSVIIVVTRWHDDDLAGRILTSETADDWTVISLPAIATEKEKYRKVGDALWASQFSVDNLLKTKAEVGSYEWSSLYQQNPIDAGTQEFKKKNFQYVTKAFVKSLRTTCFVTIDPAIKEKDTADYTGTVVNRIDEDNNWYIKASHARMDSVKLIDHIFTVWEKEKPDAIGIEETTYLDAVYPFLKIEMVKRNVFPVIYPLKHHGTNKELRIRALLPRYEADKIFHIEGECEDLEEEQLRFPKGKNDDIVDALAYQEQIVQPPLPLDSRIQEVRNEMAVNDRTGYMN